MPKKLKLKDFDYNLSEKLIATHPVEPRDRARLLILDKKTGQLEHKYFYEIIDYLEAGDVLVLNNSKVIPARLWAHDRMNMIGHDDPSVRTEFRASLDSLCLFHGFFTAMGIEKPTGEFQLALDALLLDQLIGEHQTVIKSLSRLHADIQSFSGATILGDGTLALILDVPALLRSVEQAA